MANQNRISQLLLKTFLLCILTVHLSFGQNNSLCENDTLNIPVTTLNLYEKNKVVISNSSINISPVTYEAEECINLTPNFEVPLGIEFEANIKTCPYTINQKYGGNENEVPYEVNRTSDGGYIITGRSGSSQTGDVSEQSNGDNDYWVLRLDKFGNKVWDRLLGGTGNEWGLSGFETSDGNFLISGWSTSSASGDVSDVNHGSVDLWILKLDPNGAIIWDKLLGGSGVDYATSSIETSSGDYIITGRSTSSASGDISELSNGSYDNWIVKLDSDGIIIWDRLLGGSDFDYSNAIAETLDQGYVITGISRSSNSKDVTDTNNGIIDVWVYKLDENGILLWNHLYGGAGSDTPRDITLLNNDEIVIIGQTSSSMSGDLPQPTNGSSDYWVLKLDNMGQLLWQQVYGGNGIDSGFGIAQSSDGGFILAGYTWSIAGGDVSVSSSGKDDYWIVKIDSAGNIIWDKTIGSNQFDKAADIVKINDGGYLVVGSSGTTTNYDYWVLKINENGSTN